MQTHTPSCLYVLEHTYIRYIHVVLQEVGNFRVLFLCLDTYTTLCKTLVSIQKLYTIFER